MLCLADKRDDCCKKMLVLFTCNHNEVSFKRQLSEFANLPTKLEALDRKNCVGQGHAIQGPHCFQSI